MRKLRVLLLFCMAGTPALAAPTATAPNVSDVALRASGPLDGAGDGAAMVTADETLAAKAVSPEYWAVTE